MSIFRDASKQKLRFQTSKGLLSTEQLWDLTQTDLTNAIRNQKKVVRKNDDDELGFLDEATTVDKTEQLRFDVLKEVYLTKKADNEAARTARENKEHNQKILELISEKKDGELKGKSIQELEAMLK